MLTDDAADRCRIVAVDVANSGRDDCREVVPEADDTLMEAHFFGGRLVCHYPHDARPLLRVFRLDGVQERDITVPAMSTLSGRLDKHDAIEGTADSGIVHFQVESYTAGPSLWRHDQPPVRPAWSARHRSRSARATSLSACSSKGRAGREPRCS